jgi:hypothetical protein
MAKLIDGPADGHDVIVDRTEIWVALVDDQARVLPDRPGHDLEDLLNRVGRGNWHLYRQAETEPVTYRWVESTSRN